MSRLSISLLGTFRVALDDQAITDFGYDKVRALLAYLVMQPGQPISREWIGTLLWQDQTSQASRHSLSQAWLKLRQAIQDQGATPPSLLSDRDAIQFNPASDYALDVSEFTALLDACDSHAHAEIETCAECTARLIQAVDLYRGGFLEGILIGDSAEFEEWVVVRREGLHRRALTALDHLTRHHKRRRQHALAQKYALRQLELEPFREEAHRDLMQSLVASGQRSAALAQYENCRRILTAELGVEPSAETRTLYERIRAAGETRSHNLPLPLPALIGRETELEQIAHRLSDPDCRLITLTGPGGIGKTSLALRAAEEHLSEWLDGTYFVSLSALSHQDQIPGAITDALSIGSDGDKDARAQILNWIKEKSLLLVLDNFEHLVPATNLLNDILRAASRLKVIVTSREPLFLRAEHLIRVEGLAFPQPHESVTENRMSEFGAVRLFIQRAQRITSAFAPTQEDYAAIARICRFVEGSPLGIELAAGQCDAFPCSHIADEIQRDLDFLATPLHDVDTRHQSIRALFEHSLRQLSENDQRALQRLSVFHNPLRHSAAREVAGITQHQLATLVSKSFLHIAPDERYDLHPLLKQFLGEKLSADEGDYADTLARHGAYHAKFMRELTVEANRGVQNRSATEIRASLQDLIAALVWATGQRKTSLVTDIANELYNSLAALGCYETGHALFDQAARTMEQYRDPTTEERSTLARIMGYSAIFNMWMNVYDDATVKIKESLAIAREIQDQWQISMCLHALGLMAFEQGDYGAAKPFGEEALATCRAMGDLDKETVRLQFLGEMAFYAGTLAEAHDHFEKALAIGRSLGHTVAYSIAIPLYWLGVIAHRRGDPVSARKMLGESLTISPAIHQHLNTAECLRALGVVATDAGEYDRAADLFRQSRNIFAEINKKPEAALRMRNEGWLAECQVDFATAQRCYQESLVALERANQKIKLPPVQADLGRVSALLGEWDSAERALRQALADSQRTGYPYGIALALASTGIFERERCNLDSARQKFCDALRVAINAEEIYEAVKIMVELAEVLAKQGADQKALTMLGFALAHVATPHSHKTRAKRVVDEIAARVAPQLAEEAIAQGRRVKLTEFLDSRETECYLT